MITAELIEADDIEYSLDSENKEPPYDWSHMGGWWSGGTWEDFTSVFDERMVPYLDAAKKYVIDNDIHWGANQACNEYLFKFSDDSIMSVSWRAWGDLFGAIWGADSYMDYYWR